MKHSIFEYRSYKDYLRDQLRHLGESTKGIKSKISLAMGCQPAYTAQVLNGGSHFSLEQAESLNEFLGHSDAESSFFLSILQYERAGTKALRDRLLRDIEALTERQKKLKNRLGVRNQLSNESRATYYSAWYYGAIHAAASILELNTPGKIATYLKLEPSRVSNALEFLEDAGLVLRDGDKLKIGTAQIHLPENSKLILHHHTNWRHQSIRSVERGAGDSLHYSSVISISEKDSRLLREMLIAFLKDAKALIRESPEEKVCSLNLDFFEVGG